MSLGDFQNEETIQERVQKDIRYIANDLICQIQEDKDEYCKFSRPLNAITILSFNKDNYIKYWTQVYLHYPEQKQQIMEACNKKFEGNLISREKMLELVENSKDNTEDKIYMIAKLKGLPVPKQLTPSQLKKEAQMRAYFSRLEEINEEEPVSERFREIPITQSKENTKKKTKSKKQNKRNKLSIKQIFKKH